MEGIVPQTNLVLLVEEILIGRWVPPSRGRAVRD